MSGYGSYFEPRIEQMGQYNPRSYSLVGGRPSAKQVKYAASVAVGAAIAGALGYGAKKYKKGGTKYLKKRQSTPKINKKRIKYLSKKMDNNEATILYRDRAVTRAITSTSNECVYVSRDACSKGLIENAITNLKFFDPADPANLQTVNYNTGTFQKQVLIKPSSYICIRNNYAVPCLMQLYLCKIRSDTNNSPESAITAGFADVGALSVKDPLTQAKDSLILKDLWILKQKRKSIVLQPGQEIKAYHSEKEFSYDTSLVDTHNQQYVKIFKSFSWLVRVEGVVAHDPIENEQGTVQAGVDILVDRHFVVKYDAGVDLHEIQTLNGSATFTDTNPKVTTLANEQNLYQL